jgi:hypothetical protein
MANSLKDNESFFARNNSGDKITIPAWKQNNLDDRHNYRTLINLLNHTAINYKVIEFNRFMKENPNFTAYHMDMGAVSEYPEDYYSSRMHNHLTGENITDETFVNQSINVVRKISGRTNEIIPAPEPILNGILFENAENYFSGYSTVRRYMPLIGGLQMEKIKRGQTDPFNIYKNHSLSEFNDSLMQVLDAASLGKNKYIALKYDSNYYEDYLNSSINATEEDLIDSVRYNVASILLVADSDTYVMPAYFNSFHKHLNDPNKTIIEKLDILYETNYGAPKGLFVVNNSSGVPFYSREFENAFVLVNPSNDGVRNITIPLGSSPDILSKSKYYREGIVWNLPPKSSLILVIDPWCNFADINRDGSVDGTDLSILSKWFYEVEPCSPENEWCDFADINNDGVVNGADLSRLKPQFGKVNCSPEILFPEEEIQSSLTPSEDSSSEISGGGNSGSTENSENLLELIEILEVSNEEGYEEIISAAESLIEEEKSEKKNKIFLIVLLSVFTILIIVILIYFIKEKIKKKI